MNVKERRKKSIVEVAFALLFLVGGYLIADRLVLQFLNLKTVTRHGVIYYYADNGFNAGSIITAVGCMLMGLGIKHLVNFCNMWGNSVNRSYKALESTKLGIFAFFMLCLNFFTHNYFVALTERDFKVTGGEEALAAFEKYNLYLSFAFVIVILFMVMYNGIFKNKLRLSYYVATVLAIVWTHFAIFVRTISVSWIWIIYGMAVVLFAGMLNVSGDYYAPGVGFPKEDEIPNEHIAFFVSSHGMGHIMRVLPVVRNILETTECEVLLVSDSDQIEIAMEYFDEYFHTHGDELLDRIDFEVMKTDFGLAVKDGSLLVDKEATAEGVIKYISDMPNNGFFGVSLIDKYKITKVVSDITPYAFMSASFRKLPSILMANFTWIEIYQEFLPEALIKPYRDAFSRAGKVLRYGLCNEPTKARFENACDVGFVCREFDEENVKAIRAKYNFGKPIVYFSIGMSNNGISEEADVSALPYTFIVTEGVGLTGDNVYRIPRECMHTHDYVKAADFCILKAGWSTISECMIAGKPMALLGRDDVFEDRTNIAALCEMGRGIKIDVQDIYDMATVMKCMEEYEFITDPLDNNYKEIAAEIVNYH